jgi:hypothetical protein
MNCSTLISSLGFECRPLGEGALRIWSPFTYGQDGECVGLYVEDQGATFRVTDNAEAVCHAMSMGVSLSKARMEALRKAIPADVQLSPGGSMYMTVREPELPSAIASVLSASMAVGHFEAQWAPRMRGAQFTSRVAELLVPAFGGALNRDVQVLGASGHQLELPFLLLLKTRPTYIQTVSSDEESIDWNNVYAGFGKMMDLRNAGAETSQRIVVLDDEAIPQDELSKAVSVLQESSTVVPFSSLPAWVAKSKMLAA